MTKRFRAEPKTRTIPVIVLSARAGEEAPLDGFQAGADDYLVKPFSAREMISRINSNLELARTRRETTEILRRRTEQFETLLACPDPDLLDWIVNGIAPPPEHDHDVMHRLRRFCTALHPQ